MIKEEAAPLASASTLPRAQGMAAMGGIAGAMPGRISNGFGSPGGIGGPIARYEALAESSIAPDTHTASFDDFFEYRINQPVTIRKNESALVPILQVKIPAESVTLVSTNGAMISQRLRALWLTNNSGMTTRPRLLLDRRRRKLRRRRSARSHSS